MTDKQKAIILSMADNDMNASKVGREFGCSRNGIQYNFERIEDETGLNPKKFYDLLELIEIIKKA